MASWVTPLMVKVLQISKSVTYVHSHLHVPFHKTDLLHHVDEGWLELKSIVSNINYWSSTMLVVVGAENSWRVLLAIASKIGVKLRLVWLSSSSKARTFLSLALVLLINASGSST